jgi:hypothetical protein
MDVESDGDPNGSWGTSLLVVLYYVDVVKKHPDQSWDKLRLR